MNLSTLHLATRSLTRKIILSNEKFTILPCLKNNNVRSVHITSNVMKEFRVGIQKVRSRPVGKLVALEGESTISLVPEDSRTLFPTASTPNTLFDGVPYNELYIVNVKSTPNNTIMSFTDYKGLGIMTHSSGIEGFKHAKKGTNIAAQQAALTFGIRILKYGIQTVRLRVQGTGPGRMGAIKGFQLSELNVVSITDDTRVSWNPPRPRKQKRL